jgi:hypothetical protein
MKQMTKQEFRLTQTYVKTKTKDLPFYKCYVSSGWELSFELVSIVMSKRMSSGKLCMAMYLIDKGCLGLKSTFCQMNFTDAEYKSFVVEMFNQEGRKYEEISVENAHNLIFGAIDYAESCGFKPMDKDWDVTKHFLNEDFITDKIDDIAFGKDGIPCYFSGPYDDVKKVMATLRKNFGDGNFHYTAHIG